MQDDVTDGVKHLIAEGIVDPARICIGGGSYGGYATMMGLVKEPDLFKCGIDVVGVVDLSWWIDLGYTDFNSVDPEASGKYLKATIGDPSADKEMMRKYSPRLHADQIKAPVLIIHGGGDVRVPIAHAEGMRDALTAAGKPYEWLVFPEEGHGFVKAENLTAYYTKMEEFLAKHLGK
jgi:dipeptidyl aminopeptidase/acylaminoacyl peptidase